MPNPLNPGGLFSPELVKLFEEVERWALALRQTQQDLVKMDYGAKPNPLIDAEDRQLPQLRDLLSRQYLRIGFLGGSQAGKSRTLNNFIGRKVVPVGELRSCTSTRIRLRTTEGPGRIVLRFMTYESYRQRRDDVGADLLKLYDRSAAHSIPDDRVLELLQHALTSGRFSEGDMDVADFLSRILQSGARFPEVLAKKGHQPVVETLKQSFENFEDLETVLAKIAKHPEDSEVRKESLLEEIDVCHREIPIPTRLELLDMPGLNTTQGQDEAYTLRAAAELDGALIAMNLGGNLKDPGTYKLTTLLSERFPDLAQRIWIVATKADTVPKDLLHGKPGNNLIDSLGKELSRHKIESDRVLLISNEYRDEIANNLPKHEAIRLLKLESDRDGSPRLPQAINDHPHFRHAFECLAEDGGFGRLTRMVNTQVSDAVLEQVTSDVIGRLNSLLTSLEKLLKDAEYVSSIGKSGRSIARAWRKVFDKLLNKSSGPDDELVEVGRMLLSSFNKVLKESITDFPPNAEMKRVVQLLRNLQEELSDCAETIFAENGKIFDYLGSVSARVAELTQKLDKPSFDPIDELRTRLRVIDEHWLERLRTDIRGLNVDVLVGPDGKTSLAAKEVVKLFEAKVQQVCRQTIHRVDSLVRWHLFEVSQKLGRITAVESDSPASAEDYKRYLSDTQRFRTRLTRLQNPGEPTTSTPSVTTVQPVVSPAAQTSNPAASATEQRSGTPETTSKPQPKKQSPSSTPKPAPRPRPTSTNEPGNSEEW